MTRAFVSDDLVYGSCHQCGRFWLFEGKHAQDQYNLMRRRYRKRLCEYCRAAVDRGFYQFACQGCNARVEDNLEVVKPLLNVFGKAFCRSCMVGFYGHYDPDNPALKTIMESIAEKRKTRSRSMALAYSRARSYRALKALDALYASDDEFGYAKAVRKLSRSHLKTKPDLVNPKGHPIGLSGRPGAYQLDHMVPVSVCWGYYVAVEDAASIANLQVIPWFVNISRGDKFDLERLVGWPYPNKCEETTRLKNLVS